LTNNLLAFRGGKPYIMARLHRAPNESKISWEGNQADNGSVGRRERAYLINDAGRVTAKINQYLFAEPAEREGIDATFAANVTGTGESINSFWQSVSESFTAGQWVWLQVDRSAPDRDPETGALRPRTRAQREAAGDRVRWILWQSTDVIDWRFDQDGQLVWLLTQEDQYDNADPMAEATLAPIRTLWIRGTAGKGATWHRYTQDKDKVIDLGTGDVSTQEIPFICLGKPSGLPWWFDDVELLQASAMNLDSLHQENLVKTVYPQLVISSAMLNNLRNVLEERTKADGQQIMEMVRELVRGLDRPFVEAPEDKGLTRYLQPLASDLKALPDERTRLQKALFDMVGLALFNRETRQVQSAEAKQFDHMDTEATLQNRAMLMQETEIRLVALSARIDTTFQTYVPVWPTTFDVPDTATDVQALTTVANLTELTPTLRRKLLKAAAKILDGIEPLTDEERDALTAELEALPDQEPTPPAAPAPERLALPEPAAT
jgi:hypothetical protein